MNTLVHKAFATDVPIRAAAIVCTDLIDDVFLNQNLGSLAALCQGRCLIGAALMAAQLKDGHAISVRLQGDGPLRELYAEALYEGVIRGYVGNPAAMLAAEQPIRIGDGIGKGLLKVSINTPYRNEPQLGTVDIATGEIGDDLAHYFFQSQQTRTIVALGTHLNDVGRVDAAGGVLVEILEHVPESAITQLEHNVRHAPAITEMILGGASASEIMATFMDGIDYTEFVHPHPWRYECKCSDERVRRVLRMLGATDRQELVEKGEPAKVQCELCGKEYVVSHDELVQIARQ